MNLSNKQALIAKSKLGPYPIFMHSLIYNCVHEAMTRCEGQSETAIRQRAYSNLKHCLGYFTKKSLYRAVYPPRVRASNLSTPERRDVNKNDLLMKLYIRHKPTLTRVLDVKFMEMNYGLSSNAKARMREEIMFR